MEILKPLTKRQQEILDFIKQRKTAPPTRAEIAKHFKFKSVNSAEEHLKAIAKKGYISLRSGTSRGISVLSQTPENNTPHNQINLPIVGHVAAGEPILAQQHIDDYLQLDQHFFNTHADYLLKVKGDSMINIGIFENDLLAIKKSNQAHNKQIVIARIENDVTVKRFFKTGSQVTLQAENDDFPDITVDLSKQAFTIEGVVVGLLRRNLN